MSFLIIHHTSSFLSSTLEVIRISSQTFSFHQHPDLENISVTLSQSDQSWCESIKQKKSVVHSEEKSIRFWLMLQLVQLINLVSNHGLISKNILVIELNFPYIHSCLSMAVFWFRISASISSSKYSGLYHRKKSSFKIKSWKSRQFINRSQLRTLYDFLINQR